ncbi:MAG TPA: lipopolysaccharide biosynthesis protein RfbH, partial [Desulfomonilaceae bacterium]|nr:lipopolysaccharide biosynthesis protein RfbH [Desulfomonilaceae bacterium]
MTSLTTAAEKVKNEILRKVEEFYYLTHAIREPFIPGKSRLPFAGRVFDESELVHLVDAALEFWLTQGRFTDRFETDLANFIGARHCIFVNSGSSANLLAFMALTSGKLGQRRIKPGDEVITVAAGFPTTVSPVIQYGAVPVFVDIEPDTYNIDPCLLRNAVSSDTKAVFVAHCMGHPFDVDAVADICRDHDLWLIEDNCDALGARYKGKLTGSFGHVSTSSFYPAHHITTGEGGAVFTNDRELARIVRSFRDWGRDCWCDSGRDNTCGKRFDKQFGELPFGYDHKYVYSHFGYNLKATDLQAAIGCAQLQKLDTFIQKRREHHATLLEGLAPLEECFVLPYAAADTEPSWFGFVMTVRETARFTRDDVVRYLEKRNIQTRMLFAGNLLRHPCFVGSEGAYRVAGGLAKTDLIMRNTFWVGVYPGLTGAAVQSIISALHEFTD